MLNFLRDRSSFKPEINESRNTPTPSVCSLPEVAITETEQKLIRLGLNSAASQGESDNCAVKLFQSLRRRGVNAEQIISSFTQQTWAMRELAAARGYVVNFGQYRGKTVGEVPPSYLKWALRKHDNLSFNLRRAMQIVLNQAKSSVGRRCYLVTEFDIAPYARDGKTQTPWKPIIESWAQSEISVADVCAAAILELARLMPLVLVVFSGGKSLHAWWRVFEKTEAQSKNFMRQAVHNGADSQVFDINQFVRLPGGIRDNGNRQTIYYIAPDEALPSELIKE